MDTEAQEFIPGRNGGRLLPGGKPGNRGGGNIKSQVRELCAKGFEEAAPEIIRIAKGERDVSAGEQITAFNSLGKYGMGEAAAVALENGDWLKTVAEVTAEYLGPEMYEQWWARLMATLDSMK